VLDAPSNMERWLSPKVGFALVAALYLLSFPYHPGLRSPNELCRLFQSRSLVDFHTLNINGELQQLGMVGDLSCTSQVQGDPKLYPCVGPDAPRQNVVARFYYPSKAPLVSFLGAPVYWVLTKFGPVTELSQVLWSRLFVTIIPALLLLVLLRRFLSAYVEPATAEVFTVVYALGTMAYSYAEAFMSHQLTAVLLFCAFFCAWKVERGEWKWWGYALAGLAASAAVVSEYTAALGVVCIAAYTVAARWQKWRALAQASALVIAGAVPLLGLLLWYHAETFGSPFTSGYKFLNDAGYMHWHQGGFLGIKVPDLKALGLSYFSPLRGLFALSPFLAAAFFGLRDVRAKERHLFIFFGVLLVAHSYFTSSFSYDSWGWTVGPRHLTGMVPFLMLPVAMLFERLKKSSPARAGVIAGLAVSSVIATVLVGFVNYVPDDVSTSVWALAVPMLVDGFFPVSWLAAFFPNPASGAVLLVLLLLVTAWLLTRFKQAGLSVVMAVVVVLHLGALRLVPSVPGDPGAKSFIESVWVAPAGKTIDFRGR
jgi:4-amino-4-deoxy-L-arabinose transferase-like glycosyltransferase